MGIERNWTEENNIPWIVDGEPVDAEVTNRPAKYLFGNTAFLYDRLVTNLQEVEIEHHEIVHFTSDNGEVAGEFSKLVISVNHSEEYPDKYYAPGAKILVNGEWKTIHHVDKNDSSHPDTWFVWVYSDTEYPEGTVIEAGDVVYSKMVYVPRVVIPANGITQGFPPKDIVVGGFYIDKYECSAPGATANSAGKRVSYCQPISQEFVVPYSNVSFNTAKKLSENRIVNGVRCQLPNLRHFAEIIIISMYMRYVMRGNDNWGRFSGDPNSEAAYGVADKVFGWYLNPSDNKYYRQVCLTGSGPRWSHNGLVWGVWDIYGNLREWVDAEIAVGLYRHKKGCLIAYDAPAGTQYFIAEIETPWAWGNSGIIYFDNYPGLGYVSYVGIENVGGGLYKFELNTPLEAELKKGDKGVNYSDYCAVPNGTRALLNTALTVTPINNTVEVLDNTVLTSRSNRNDAFLVGDIIQIRGIAGGGQANEQAEILSVSYEAPVWTLQLNRGINGIVVQADEGTAFVVISPDMNNINSEDETAYQRGKIVNFRSDDDLIALLFPGGVENCEEDVADFYIRHWGIRKALRGTCYSDEGKRKEYYLAFMDGADDLVANAGFRVVFDPSRKT